MDPRIQILSKNFMDPQHCLVEEDSAETTLHRKRSSLLYLAPGQPRVQVQVRHEPAERDEQALQHLLSPLILLLLLLLNTLLVLAELVQF